MLLITATAAQAVSWKWTASNIYDPLDATTKLTGGTATLYSYLASAEASTAVAIKESSVSSGSINVTFEDTTNTTGGNDYSFYFVLVSGDYTFTSDTKANLAAPTTASTKTIGFGNLATATTTGGGWVSSAVIPEPTSGLLMLLGMASLALRRRRA